MPVRTSPSGPSVAIDPLLVGGDPVTALRATNGAEITVIDGVGVITATGDRLTINGSPVRAILLDPSLAVTFDGDTATLRVAP